MEKYERESIRDYVYRTLKTNIQNLIFEPGMNISEKEVAAKLKVSRTPVREAFVKLAQEDLIDIFPQKGSFVSLIDLALVEESRFVRENLEKAVIKMACEKLNEEHILKLKNLIKMQELCREQKNYAKLFELDEQFHFTIFEGCRKERTWSLIQQISTHFNRVRMLRLSVNYNWDIILSQHSQIVNSIEEKNPDRAVRVMEDHLTLVVIEKDELKAKYPTFFK